MKRYMVTEKQLRELYDAGRDRGWEEAKWDERCTGNMPTSSEKDFEEQMKEFVHVKENASVAQR